GHGLIGDHIDIEVAVLDVGRDEQRAIEAARVILQGLPASEIVNAGPRSYRPTIVKLPKDGAHGARASAAQMLRADLDAFGLQHLAGVKERGEIARLGIILEHVIVNDGIAFGVFLMGEHDGSEDAGAILGLSEGFNGAHFREGLKAVLGHEAGEVLLIFGEGNAAMPDAPIVEIAGLEAGGSFLVIGAGRTGPVGRFGSQAIDGAGENAAEDGEIVLPHLIANGGGQLFAATPMHGLFGFVVAGPDDDAGMFAQAADLEFGFEFNVLLEGVGAGLPIVAEHEVLPDHDAEFVADVEELLGLVIASAPVADHIHVGVACGLQDAAILFGGDARGETVEGDDVGALAEDGDPVDYELEGAAPLIEIAAKNDGAKAGASRGLVFGASADLDLGVELIERLRAVSGREPKLRGSDLDGKVDMIEAGVECDRA